MKLRVCDLRAEELVPVPARWLAVAPELAAPVGLDSWQAALVLLDDARMSELNGRHRGVPGPTDVLAFPSVATTGSGPPALTAGRAYAGCDLWLSPWEAVAGAEVGEVVIAPAYVAARCSEHGWPLIEELAMLTVHGLLHLLGWEHEGPAATRAMRAQEAALLARHGLRHPLRSQGGAAH